MAAFLNKAKRGGTFMLMGQQKRYFFSEIGMKNINEKDVTARINE